MRGLTILLASADRPRLRSALTLAIAQASSGGRARLFFDAAAVPLLAAPSDADDDRQAAAGQPRLAELIALAHDAGVRMLACQTGLALAALHPADFDPRLEWTGVTALLATLADDRLLAI